MPSTSRLRRIDSRDDGLNVMRVTQRGITDLIRYISYMGGFQGLCSRLFFGSKGLLKTKTPTVRPL